MYDTINLRLKQADVPNTDLFAEAPYFLKHITETLHPNGVESIRGNIDNLLVLVSPYSLNIKGGSLCKWFLGDNMQIMSRKSAEEAIERLSDTLHLPMDKAQVTRLDVANNFILKHPVCAYTCHLGTLQGKPPLKEPDALYYHYSGGRLCFYDKVKEQKKSRQPIPEMFVGRNVLRYEQRYLKDIPRQLNRSEVTAYMLYDEGFYIDVLKRWYAQYQRIKKINEQPIDLTHISTKEDLYTCGIVALAQRFGGFNELVNHITILQKKGSISRQKAFNMRDRINKASVHQFALYPSEEIEELDKKVMQAIRYFR